MSENNDPESLGKGEVDSSILSGSTREPLDIAYFCGARDKRLAAKEDRS
jgi:hypothetical protein